MGRLSVGMWVAVTDERQAMVTPVRGGGEAQARWSGSRNNGAHACVAYTDIRPFNVPGNFALLFDHEGGVQQGSRTTERAVRRLAGPLLRSRAPPLVETDASSHRRSRDGGHCPAAQER